MLINVRKEYTKALNKHIVERIGNDDPMLTYQEFVLYYILYIYACEADTDINPDEEYECQKGGWIDMTWNKLKASKTHSKVFDKKWDEVF